MPLPSLLPDPDSTLTLIRRIIAAQNAAQETTMTIHGSKSFDTVEHSRFELWQIDQVITDLDKAGYAVVSKEGGSVEHLEGLLDEATSANESLRARNEKLEQRILELSRLAQDAKDAPLTLDSLREAWEGAEVPTEDTPIREDDTVIVRNDSGIGGWFVRAAHPYHDFELEARGAVRVLTRAPQREPWADLADVLIDEMGAPEGIAWNEAKRLHERGVRVVTEGDESNE